MPETSVQTAAHPPPPFPPPSSRGSGMDDQQRVELVLSELEALPTLSPVATRLLSLGTDNEVELDAIVELIEADPTLTGKILGLCRRAGLSISEQITTVKHAAVMLGLETVRSAVLSVAVYEVFEAEGEQAEERAMAAAIRSGSDSLAQASFDRTGFWRYSIGVATAAEMLAASRKDLSIRPQEAFVAGLLAEIGKLMLDFAVPKGYARVLEYAAQRNVSASKASRQLLGIDHHQAGAYVGERWGLPEALLEVMRGEVVPEENESSSGGELLGVVGTGIALCRTQHIGFSGEPVLGSDPVGAVEIMGKAGFTPQVLASVSDRLHASVSARCEVMGLDEQSAHHLLLHSIARANEHLDRLNQNLTRRTRQAREMERTVTTLEWFGRAVKGVGKTISAGRIPGAIAVSAARTFGGDRWGLMHLQGERWIWSEHDARGIQTDEQTVEASSIAQAIERLEAEDRRHFVLDDRAVVLGSVAPRSDAALTKAQSSLISQWSLAVRAMSASQQAAMLAVGMSDRAVAPGPRNPGPRAPSPPQPDPEPLDEALPPAPQAQEEVVIPESELLTGTLSAIQSIAMHLRSQGPLLKSLVAHEQHAPLINAVVTSTASLAALNKGVAALRQCREPESGTHSLREIADSAVDTVVLATRWKGTFDTRGVDPANYLLLDRGMIESALNELLLNAIDSSPSGEVLIEAHRAGPKGRWELCVVDRGDGFDPQDAERMFDPFVSGRSGSKHAGLGLTRVRAWMRSHGGDAELKRTEDGRTRAKLIFTELGSPAGERRTAA